MAHSSEPALKPGAHVSCAIAEALPVFVENPVSSWNQSEDVTTGPAERRI
jgi:hypothetical protein